MPFFLFCDTLLVGSLLLLWLARDPRSVVPSHDGAIAVLLGLHATLLLAAVHRRHRQPFHWFSFRRMTNALALGLLLLAISRAYLLLPGAAGIDGWEFLEPPAIAQQRLLVDYYYPPTNTPWAYGGHATSEALASVYALGMLGPWAIGGLGLAALCFGLLTLELSRSGAQQLAILLGAVGYAFLFLGEPLAVAAASPGRNTWLIAGAQFADRFLIGAGAGCVFLATRHLLGAGLTLGLHEWAVRYLLDDDASTRFAPLFLTHTSDQVHYWLARLTCSTAACGTLWLIYRRVRARTAASAPGGGAPPTA